MCKIFPFYENILKHFRDRKQWFTPKWHNKLFVSSIKYATCPQHFVEFSLPSFFENSRKCICRIRKGHYLFRKGKSLRFVKWKRTRQISGGEWKQKHARHQTFSVFRVSLPLSGWEHNNTLNRNHEIENIKEISPFAFKDNSQFSLCTSVKVYSCLNPQKSVPKNIFFYFSLWIGNLPKSRYFGKSVSRSSVLEVLIKSVKFFICFHPFFFILPSLFPYYCCCWFFALWQKNKRRSIVTRIV